jgi:nucleotide-binding universal stress UspA family protein
MDAFGVLNEYYIEAGNNALKLADDATAYAAKVLRDKNPLLIITTAVIDGSPKSAILEEAETFGADLIVVGSHGYGAVDRFMLGSVSHAVSLHAKCSVEIVRKSG